MLTHLDEMKIFLEVVRAYSGPMIVESVDDRSNITSEEITEDEQPIYKDLELLKEEWLSISLNDESEEFARGYEQGLFKAVEMMESLLNTKYGRRL